MRSRTVLPLILVLTLSGVPATAQTTIGSEFLVNTTTAGSQSQCDVASNLLGDVVVVWTSDAAGNGDVLAQRYSGSGVPVGGEITIAASAEDELDPAVGMLPDGSFVVAYELDPTVGYDEVWMRRFAADGSPLGDAFAFEGFSSTLVRDPAIDVAVDGEFVVAVNAIPHIQYRLYDAAGASLGSAVQANADVVYTKLYPDVAVKPDKEFIVTWTSSGQDGDHYGVYCRRFSWVGGAGSEIQVNDYTTSAQAHPSIGMRTDGYYTITWASNGQDGSYEGVFARRFSAWDAKLGIEFQVNTYVTAGQSFPRIAVNGQNEFTITWNSGNQDGYLSGVYAQEYDETGAAVGPEYRVNTTTDGSQSTPGIAVGGQRQIIVWSGAGGDPDGSGIQGQWYTAPPSAPDLQVSEFACPAEFDGGAAAFPCTVTVHSGGLDSGSFTVALYLSEDSEITVADTVLDTYTVASLAADTDTTAILDVSIPPGTPGNQFWVGAMADVGNDVVESGEDNNTASTPVTYLRPDLQVTGLACPAEFRYGGAALPCTVTVHNGGIDADSFDVTLHISDDSEISGADTVLDTYTVAGLVEGADETMILSVVVPPDAPSGQFWIGAFADAADDVIESDEINNTASTPVAYLMPDLTISVFSCPAEIRDVAVVFPCTVTVHNGGPDVGSFDVRLHLSTDDVISGADAVLDSFTVAGLAEDEETTVIIADLLTATAPRGRFWIGAVVDPENEIVEIDDDNNTASTAVTNQVPVIESLADVHGDQGGQLHLAWWACPRDTVPDGTITEYTVWRAIDTDAGTKMLGAGALSLDEYLALDAAKDKAPPVVRSDLLGKRAIFWELVGTQPAYFLPGYAMAVPTLFDSTAVNTNYHYVQVIAHLAEPWPYYVSAVDSARSTDDLAPGALKNLVADYAAGNTVLDWDDAPEPDLGLYRVYRGDDPGFVAGAGNLVAEVTDSQWADPDAEPWDHHYKVAAVDGAGNEGPAVSPAGVSDVPDMVVVYGNALHDAVPNPFNPKTLMSFDLASAGRARLAVYDVAGRRVAVLVDEHRDAGRHEVPWDGTDNQGRTSAAGVYFYRLDAEGISATKRMTLVK